MMDRYAIIDIETTGGHRQDHKITEIAIICVDGREVVSEWSSLINPERPIPWSITKLTGITNQMVAEAPYFYSVAKKIIELTEERIFVAHNVFFDYRFLQKEFSELGFSFQRQTLCTVRQSRSAFPGLASYSLKNLCQHFQIPREFEHRALDDAKACWVVLQKILKANPDETVLNISKVLPANLQNTDIEKIPCRPGVYFFYTEKNHLLYIGKAKNLKARVLQHFQTVGKSKRDLELRKKLDHIHFIEAGSEFAASLLEMQFIKTMKPSLNRAGRKTHFRYSLQLHLAGKAGEELRVSNISSDEGLNFGSRKSAEQAREKIYKEAFGLTVDTLFFSEQMSTFHSHLGREKIFERLNEKLDNLLLNFTDQIVKIPGRTDDEVGLLIIEKGNLKELRFQKNEEDCEIYPLSDYPDMRRLVSQYLKKSAT